jgi:hypothetical protein
MGNRACGFRKTVNASQAGMTWHIQGVCENVKKTISEKYSGCDKKVCRVCIFSDAHHIGTGGFQGFRLVILCSKIYLKKISSHYVTEALGCLCINLGCEVLDNRRYRHSLTYTMLLTKAISSKPFCCRDSLKASSKYSRRFSAKITPFVQGKALRAGVPSVCTTRAGDDAISRFATRIENDDAKETRRECVGNFFFFQACDNVQPRVHVTIVATVTDLETRKLIENKHHVHFGSTLGKGFIV